MLLGLDGVLELEVEGRGRRIGAGDGWVVAPGDRHDFEARAGSRCLVLDTTQPLWARCAGRPPLAPQLLSLARYLALCLTQRDAAPIWRCSMARPCCWKPGAAAAPTAARARRIDWPALAAWAAGALAARR